LGSRENTSSLAKEMRLFRARPVANHDVFIEKAVVEELQRRGSEKSEKS
jgi:hypothetical protein